MSQIDTTKQQDDPADSPTATPVISFHPERGMASCGLACAVCSAPDCPGCAMKGCQDAATCEIRKCCFERHLDGCHACGDFPCDADMFKKPRVRAFIRCMREDGVANVLDGLRRNAACGIAYHRPNGLTGDYDAAAETSEEEVLRLIRYGQRPDPYTEATPLASDRFTLRPMKPDDAEALLACYADPRAWPFFNDDNCSGHFMFKTRKEMGEAIRIWIICQETRAFMRYTLLDNGVPFGTVEFCPRNELHPVHGRVSIVRVDVDPAHEQADDLYDLLKCTIRQMMPAFRVDALITKAVPQAVERIAALKAWGFRPTEDQQLTRGFPHYHLWLPQPSPLPYA